MELSGEWVSQEFENLAQLLYEYDHNLRLEMVPPEHWHTLVDKSKIFKVVNISTNQVVLFASGLDSPQKILARVWGMDQTKHNVVEQLDRMNTASLALDAKKMIDEEDAQKDLALFIIKNKKSTWHHDGRVRDEHFNDKGPVRKVIL